MPISQSVSQDTSGVELVAHVDTSPTNGSISALDLATTTLTGANGQIFYIGTPTTNSSANFSLPSVNMVSIESSILGTGGTLVVEVSIDGSVWFRPTLYQPGTQSYSNGFTLPFFGILNVAGIPNLRVRSTVSWSGSATIIVKQTINSRSVTIGDALPTGGNTIGAVTQSGTWTVQPGNTPNTTPWLVTEKIDLTPASPTAATVGITSAQVVAANAARKGLVLTNTSGARISLGFGASAVLNSGITLYPGGIFVMDTSLFDTAVVNAIASAAASNLAIQEYS